MSRKHGSPAARRVTGMTLIEVIMFIVIVSVGLMGVLSVFNIAAKSSADPMVRKQAITLAEQMLEEILLKDYENDAADPGNASSTLGCTANTAPSSAACLPNDPLRRQFYNDVDDYKTWNQTGIKDITGTAAIAGLENYTVAVAVATSSDLGAAVPAKKVTVAVSGRGETITLSGYRTKHE